MNTVEELKIRIDAGYRLVGVETRDDAAAESAIDEVAGMLGICVDYWSYAADFPEDNGIVTTDCISRLVEFLRYQAEKRTTGKAGLRIIVLSDVNDGLSRSDVIARIKALLKSGGVCGEDIVLIVTGRTVVLPQELREMSCVVTHTLPSEEDITVMLDNFLQEKNGLSVDDSPRQEIVRALKGIPKCSVPRLLGVVVGKTGRLNARDVRTEKAEALRRNGLLELVDISPDSCEAGGMENLRGYLSHISRIFANQEEARKFGVDAHRGILIAGMPGCGKSLAVKFAAKQFALPLLRLDMGRLMGRYNGESECNLREALATAEAQAPCILWIDEIEKAFAGVGKDCDNGVATRLFGSFLTWMNERSAPVYTMATANDIQGLPPEFLRRGRFDELFFVDLPMLSEAESIFRVHLARRGCKIRDTEITELATAAYSRGFSGVDIESAVKLGVEMAFERRIEARQRNDGEWNKIVVKKADFDEAMSLVKSTSETMGGKVHDLRERFEMFRLTPASLSARNIGETKGRGC